MTLEEFMGGHENYDNFPIGLRVLAVDDDPVCLKLLETLLRKCQYHVTTTSQARMALKMLKENKGRFDLVISDVHMPDMDGFKLLEFVGLEMDLPVIMLSANGDPKLVMKGVTHGACDYLLKPVRLEELKNIWQHVIRKKGSGSKNQNKSTDQVKALQGSGESPMKENADQNGKVNRKRKDENDESEDDGSESDDSSQQKKPRVVWSIELHRKFVGAVNQLGIEKAVPKRILDVMNVEGLTRENVASHLQKYRLYLKRIANQQVNMASILGIKDAHFMCSGSLDRYGDFRTLTGPTKLANVSLSSYSTNGMLGRLNSPNINLRNISPSLLIPPNTVQNLNNPITSLGKLHPVLSPQNPSLFQGIPSSLDFDQFNDSRILPAGNAFTTDRGSSSNLLNNTPNNLMLLSGGVFGNQFSASFNAVQPSSLVSSTEPFQSQLAINSEKENNSSSGHFLCNNDSIELSSTNLASVPLEEQRQNYGHSSNNIFSSLNSPFNQKIHMGINERSVGSASLMEQNNSEKLEMEPRTRSNESFLLEQMELYGEFSHQSNDSFDVLMNTMMTREQDGIIPNYDHGFDDYSF